MDVKESDTSVRPVLKIAYCNGISLQGRSLLSKMGKVIKSGVFRCSALHKFGDEGQHGKNAVTKYLYIQPPAC